jgi:8-oxo-dGTP diphosphatase
VDPDGVVRAAGGVVCRRGPDGELTVALVHRPSYDDWSFPKGKLSHGESFAQAAAREVEEETGLHCRLLEELPSIQYTDGHGRPKMVRYWVMRPVDGSKKFHPNREVDEVRWLPVERARALLTHEHDRELLDELRAS